jgi:caffeoyl-CoA O-methyltransferase
MKLKTTALTPAIQNYVARNHSHADDELLSELRTRTEGLGGISQMLISPEQSTLLTLLVAATGARTAVEVGTFTGYSAICIARGLVDGGKLHCFDRSDEWTQIAREFWQRGGVDTNIELHLGDGHETLQQWRSPEPIDFAFIDADKAGYDHYFELLLPQMRPNALLILDNMLRNGRVADQNLTDEEDKAVDALNRKLARDPRVEAVLLPLADGVTICRKRAA